MNLISVKLQCDSFSDPSRISRLKKIAATISWQHIWGLHYKINTYFVKSIKNEHFLVNWILYIHLMMM